MKQSKNNPIPLDGVQQSSQDLTDKEQQLLAHLFSTKRPKLNQIASQIGSSKEMATYYYDRLAKRGVLLTISPIVNTSAAGFISYRLLFKLTSESYHLKQFLFLQFCKLPHVSFVQDLDGFYDLSVVFTIRQSIDFNSVYERVVNEFGKHIFSLKLHIFYKQWYSSLFQKSWVECETISKSTVLDSLDNQILEQLRVGDTRSLMTVATNLAIAFNTVKNRVFQLEQGGVIVGYLPQLSLPKLGLSHVKVFLDLLSMQNILAVRALLQELDTVVLISQSISPFDLEFDCYVHDVAVVSSIIDQIKKVTNIFDYHIIFVKQEQKVKLDLM